jgi:hypothetical protein
LTELTRASAIASGEWNRNGEYCSWIAWAKDPDATERNAVFYTHGGAETNWEDLELNNPTYLTLVNELDVVLISYDVSPGWFRLETGEDANSRDVFDKQLEHAAAIAWFRTHLGYTGNDYLPSGMWITTDPDFSMHAGGSSGGYDALRCQFAPDGSLPYSRSMVVTGDQRFSRSQGHTCNFVFASISQVTLSQFCEYVIDPALDGVDGTYSTNGSTAIGASTIAIDGDTALLYRANRISVNVGGTDYVFAITANYAGGAGSISVFPTSPVIIPDNTPVVFQHPNGEPYGALSWAQQYLFSSACGYIWRSDDSSGDGFPIEIKRQADVDYLFDLTNPRVHEVRVMFNGSSGSDLYTSALSGEKSFLLNWTPGEPNAVHIDLHADFQAFYAAYWLYEVAGNTATQLYVGNTTSNVNPGDPSVPWNKGRNSDFSAAILKAWLQSYGW